MRSKLFFTVITSTILSATTIHVPADQATIQAGLNAANTNDTVLVQPGTYYENIFWPDQNGIKLLSAGDSSNTTIDGGGNSSVIFMIYQSIPIDTNTVIEGFTITNGGNVNYGGGLTFLDGVSPTIRNSKITNNNANTSGGGMYLSSSSPFLMNVLISNNIASDKGGGVYLENSSPILTNTSINSNSATTNGGGMYLFDNSNPTLTYVTINGCSANYGGGIFSLNSTPTLNNVNITGNTADAGSYPGERGDGGGLYFGNASNAIINAVSITGNVADRFGGGIFLVNSNPTINSVNIDNNSAIDHGGGMYIKTSIPVLTNVTLNSNSTINYDGGGICLDQSSPILTNITLVRNTAQRYGGGIIMKNSSSPVFNNSVIDSNQAFGDGGGIFLTNSSNPSLSDVIIVDNISNANGGGLYIYNNSEPTLNNVNIINNSAENGGGIGINNSNPEFNIISIVGNTARANGGCLYVNGNSAPMLTGVTITSNFAYETSGIHINTGNPTIMYSNIINNGRGLINEDNLNIIIAYNNYWGHVSGPYHQSQNPTGQGDSTNAFVNVTPWLTTPNTNAPISPPNNVIKYVSGDVAVSWAGNQENDIAGYKVYYGNYTGYSFANSIDVGNVSSYNLAGLVSQLDSVVAVTAYDTNADGIDDQVEGHESWFAIAGLMPNPPTNLASSAGNMRINLIWDKSTESDIVKYIIYGGTSPNPTAIIDSTQSISDTTAIINGLTNGQTYYYRITAVDNYGNESDFSNEVSAIPPLLQVTSFWPKAGISGSTLNIYGTGFSTTPANNIVKFGTTVATVLSATANRLEVSVPEGLIGLVDLSVQVDSDIENATSRFTVIRDGLGTSTFALQQSISTGITEYKLVYPEDIDGDGDFDIIMGSYGDDAVSWYENTDGNGTFGSRNIISTLADQCLGVFAADIDDDGDMDVLSASDGDHKVAWYENLDGNGTFSAQKVIAVVPGNANEVFASDLDNDGDLDVLYASGGSDGIGWIENLNGAGDFGTYQVVGTGVLSAQSVFAADFENDGDMDFASASVGDNKVAWCRNNGSGSFSSQNLISTSNNQPFSLYTPDMNSDGYFDILVSSYFDDKISWYAFDYSTGNFNSSNNLVANSADHVESITAADFDGDGDQDVASVSSYDDKIAWYDNTDGTGMPFSGENVITNTLESAYHIQTADFNNDGMMDVAATTSAYGTNLVWYANNYVDNSPPIAPSNLSAVPGNQQITLNWDANSESDLAKYRIYRDNASPATTLIDSVVGSPPDTNYTDLGLTNGQTYYYRITAVDTTGNKSGYSNELSAAPDQFSAVTTGSMVTDGGSSAGVQWIDYNNDDFLDLFVANGGVNFLYKNNGDTTFTKITSGSIVTDVASSYTGTWGDYDNDGYPDLFVANELSQNNYLYHNNGDESFSKITAGEVVNDGTVSYGGAWADIENDGDLDLFVANTGVNFLYINDGNGNFTRRLTGVVATDGPSIHSQGGFWGDYNNDNYQDLFVANGSGGNFLYTNNGDGTFTKVSSGPIVTDPSNGYCGAWSDINNDGFLDLFVANANGENDYLYTNNGDGTFNKITSGPVVSSGGWGHGCGFEDYDNDGDMDLFVANFNYNGNFSYRNFMYSNNGDGTFTRINSGVIISDSTDSRGVAWGDYDRDGDLDLFIGNAGQDNILYRNNGNDNKWINLKLVGTASNRSAIGARVRVKAAINTSGSVWQMKELQSSTGFGSQSSLNAEFGLGTATIIDSIKIDWPSGAVQYFTNVGVNQFLTITESDLIPPAIPTNITATPGNQQITLNWSANTESDLAKYRIYRDNASPATTLIDSVVGSPPATNYTELGLTNGQTYYYRITAVDSAGNESDYSSEVSAIPFQSLITVKLDGTGDYTVIQSAIDASANGDTVLVYPGTYIENINFNGKNIIVKGSEIADSTIITPYNNDIPIVWFSNGENTTARLIGVELTGGGNLRGSALKFQGNAHPQIENCIITNSAGESAISFYYSGAVLLNCLIYNNTSGHPFFYDPNDYQPTIINCTIVNNNGYGTGVCSIPVAPKFINTILYGNTSGGAYGNIDVSYSLVEGGFPGIGNLDKDPAFIDYTNGDFRLSDYSPAIGVGTITGAPVIDIEGNPRPNPSGSSPDIGAYEIHLPSQLPSAQGIRDGLAADSDWSNSANSLSANWDPFIDDSTVTYEYAVATDAVDLASIIDWSPAGTDTFVTITGLSLVEGNSYFISVRGTDIHDQISDTTTTDGITVDTTLPIISSVIEGSSIADSTVLDIDGNVYQAVQIGNQIWMNKNLKVTKYRNGDVIPTGYSNSEWSGLSTGAYSIYNNDPNNADIYGNLYNWYTIGDSRNIAPAGWHVPSDDEWKQLEMYLGMSQSEADSTGWRGTDEGGKLKETGTAHWNSPNTGATNESGFTALPGGQRISNGSYNSIGSAGVFWSSTEYNSYTVWNRALYSYTSIVGRGYEVGKVYGTSIRCIKDNTTSAGGDADYQNSTDSLIVSWSGSDAASGIVNYEYAIGTTAGGTDFVGWTATWTRTADTLAGVSLAEGVTYYLSVRATDAAGNLSAVLAGDGITLDLTAPTGTTINDGSGDDIAYTGSDSTLSSNWNSFTENVSGIAKYEVAIGSYYGGTDVLNWTNNGLDTSFTRAGLSLANGQVYHASVRATDVAGNVSAIITTDGVIVDTAPPIAGTVIDGTTSDLDWTNSLTTLTGTWSGYTDSLSGIDHYRYSIGLTPADTSLVPWTSAGLDTVFTREDLTLLNGQIYYVNLQAIDQVGNTSETVSTDGITIDTVLPIVGIPTEGGVQDKDYQNQADSLILAWSGSDDASGILDFSYILGTTVGDSDVVNWTSAGTDTSATLTSMTLTEGETYYLTVRAWDVAGNTSQARTGDGITIDLTPPVTGLIADGIDADQDYSGSDSTLTFNWSGFSDEISGIWKYQYSVGTHVEGNDVLDWTDLMVDSTQGNRTQAGRTGREKQTANVKSKRFGSRKVPTAPSHQETSRSVADSVLVIEELTLMNGVTYFVSFRAIDNATNVSSVAVTDGITIDTEPPLTGIVWEGAELDLDWTNSLTTLTGTWSGYSDALSGIERYEYAIGLSPTDMSLVPWTSTGLDTQVTRSDLSLANAGTYFIHIMAIDSVGNVSNAVVSDGITVDTILPQVAIPTEGGTSDLDFQNSADSLIVAWSGSDNASGIDFYEIALGTSPGMTDIVDWQPAGDTTTTTFSSLSLTEGMIYFASVRASDVAGNQSPAMSGDGITIDLTPPVVGTILDGDEEDQAYTGSDSTLTVTWSGFSDAISGIWKYQVSVGTFPGSDDILTWVDVIMDSANGGRQIGNRFRKTPRALEILPARTAKRPSLSVKAKRSATESTRSSRSLDSTLVIQNLALSNGVTYYVSVRAVDRAINTSDMATTNGITVDTAPPLTGIVLDGSDTDLDWSNVTAIYNANWSGFNDELSGIDFYEYSLGTSPGSSDLFAWTNNDTLGSTTITDLSLTNGMTCYFSVRSTDNVGNLSSPVSSDGLTIDLVLPIISFVNEGTPPGDADYQAFNDSLTLSWDGSDDASGIDFYEYAVGTTAGDSDLVNWSDQGAATSVTLSIPGWLEGTTIYSLVRGTDLAGNLSVALSGDGITPDLSGPEGGLVFDGLAGDLDFTDATNSLQASWNVFGDSLSGVQGYEYQLGTSPGGGETVGWTSTGLDTFATTTGLSLVNAQTYYYSVRARDNVANLSDLYISDGITVDHSAPVAGIVRDGYGQDIDWTNSDTSLVLNGTGFHDAVSGIQYFEYAVGYNPGLANFIAWTTGTSDSVIVINGLTLAHGATYYGSLRAVDYFGHVSTIGSTDGITVDIYEPTVGVPNDGGISDLDFQGFADALTITWTGNDTRTVDYFMYSIGLAAGDTSVVGWTDVGTETAVTATGLTLQDAITYYANVKAYDEAGNMSTVASSDGMTIDLSPPQTGSVIDGLTTDLEFTGSATSLTASWTGFVDTVSGINHYELAAGTSPGDSLMLPWTPVGTNLSITLPDTLTLEHATRYYVSVRAVDNVDRTSPWAASNGIVTDHFGPVGTYVSDGDSVDTNYSNDDSVYQGFWSVFIDSVSGLAYYEIALYDETGSAFIVPWQENAMDTTIVLTGLNLTEYHVYSLKVRGVDQVDNIGPVITSDGITLDMSAPAIPQNLVGFFSTDRIYLTWTANSEPDLSHYTIYGGPATGPTTPILETTNPEAEAFTTGFENGQRYYLAVTATDVFRNESSTATEVSGIPQAAQITHLTPQENHVLQSGEQTLTVHFSQPLNSLGTIDLSSVAYPAYSLDTAYNSLDTSIVITVNDPYASLDTLNLSLTGILDWADNPAVDQALQFTTYLLADYNADRQVNVLDLSDFLTAWNSNDYSKELGPVTGSVPHLIPTPNNGYDLDDIMSFTRMWNWSHQQMGSFMVAQGSNGSAPEISQDGNQILIYPPANAHVGQLIIGYPPSQSEIRFDQSESSLKRMALSKTDAAAGQVLVEYAVFDTTAASPIVLNARSLTSDNTNLAVSYRFYSSDRELIGEGTSQIDVIAIPEAFALHQNYPNPFNPITRIEYDIPENTRVNITIYDILGREVRTLINDDIKAGYHSVQWNGRTDSGALAGTGMYFCRITAGDFHSVKKMVLLK